MTFAGRRELLVPPTSLQVQTGQVLLVQGQNQEQRTIATLMLTGRARPRAGLSFGAGTITWNGQHETKVLRRVGAPLDTVGANEPEPHMSVGDLVSEELALTGRPPLRGPFALDWLNQHKLGHLWGLRVDQVTTAERLDLLFELALEDEDVELLVIDTPDRHNAWDQSWYERLLVLLERTDRPLAVICLVAQVPEEYRGPVPRLGDDQHDHAGVVPAQQRPHSDGDAGHAADQVHASDLEHAARQDAGEQAPNKVNHSAPGAPQHGGQTQELDRPLDILDDPDGESGGDAPSAWARPVLHHVPEHALPDPAPANDPVPTDDSAPTNDAPEPDDSELDDSGPDDTASDDQPLDNQEERR